MAPPFDSLSGWAGEYRLQVIVISLSYEIRDKYSAEHTVIGDYFLFYMCHPVIKMFPWSLLLFLMRQTRFYIVCSNHLSTRM